MPLHKLLSFVRQWPAIFSLAAAVLLGAFLLQQKLKPRRRLGLPILGETDDHKDDFQALVEEGAKKYPNSPYVIDSGGAEMVVYPSIVWEEVKRLPETVASAKDFFLASIHGRWTYVGQESEALWKVVAVDLARSIPLKVHEKQEHCRRAFDRAIGSCDDWKEVELFPAMMRAIAQINACTFVGADLGTTEAWIKAVERYPMVVMIACFAINALPRILRPVLAPLLFLPTLYVQRQVKRMVAPVIAKATAEYQNAPDSRDHLRVKVDREVPFIAWLISRHKPGEATPQQLAVDLLLTSFESTASSASTLYNVVADLAAHPEIVNLLRQELESVMADGKLPPTNLSELSILDSVMCESFRTNPFSLFSLNRISRAPLQLSIGPRLPADTVFCVDSHHINLSPRLWHRPEHWDGLRLYRQQQRQKQVLPAKDATDTSSKRPQQFVTTGSDAPNWGDGTQACPGRFFANAAIKIALADLLLRYDFKLRDGEARPRKVNMPNGSWAPDIKARLLFRSREKGTRGS